MPAGISDSAEGAVRLCTAIIHACADVALAFKPNLAFFLAYGAQGLEALYRVRNTIPADIPVILDCKVGDIDTTSSAYAAAWFDELNADAITVHPYLGEDSISPFLNYPNKGVFVLAKTSNAGSGDLQDKVIDNTDQPVSHYIASRAAEWDVKYPATTGLVVGATFPDQLRQIRAAAPRLPVLLPGIGTQHGDLTASLDAALLDDGTGVLCSSSRGIMYASSSHDFAQAAHSEAKKLRDDINDVRFKVLKDLPTTG